MDSQPKLGSIKNLTSEDNPLQAHQTPRLDIYGHVITKKDAQTSQKIPPSWTGPSKTRTELIGQRRGEKIPHISYDLDGDGMVGGQDLVIAKRFDKDGDGRLNTTERRNAEEAIRNGYADQFTWGVEQAGPHRAYRLMQKRGQIIDSDDWLSVGETYPEFPRGNPSVLTRSELKENRDKERKSYVQQSQKRWEALHPHEVEQTIPQSEFYNANPAYQTFSAKVQHERIINREKAGLESTQDIKPDSKLSLQFVENPEIKTKSQLDQNRKDQMLNTLQHTKNYDHVDRMARMHEREIALSASGIGENLTYSQVMAQKKKETNENNVKKFSNLSIGVHGKELPKFAETNKQYWQLQDNYNPAPAIQSHTLLKATQKAGSDPFAAAIVNPDSIPPPDPFKTTYVALQPKKDVSEKPNNIVHEVWSKRLKVGELPQPARHNYRWSTTMNQFKADNPLAPSSRAGSSKMEMSTRSEQSLGGHSFTSANYPHARMTAIAESVLSGSQVGQSKHYTSHTPAGPVGQQSMRSMIRSSGFNRNK